MSTLWCVYVVWTVLQLLTYPVITQVLKELALISSESQGLFPWLGNLLNSCCSRRSEVHMDTDLN